MKIGIFTCLIMQQHTLFFKIEKYFSKIKLFNGKVNTISGLADLIEGSERAILL